MSVQLVLGKPGGGMVMSGPVTRDKLAAFVKAREAAGETGGIWCQVRKHGAVLCGLVVDARDGHGDRPFVQVDCALGKVWVSAFNARMCSGDGACRCEGGAAGAGKRSAAPAALTPLGNTGTTRVEEA